MMSKYSNSDVVVVGLIGERAREVKVMVESFLAMTKIIKSLSLQFQQIDLLC